MLKTFDTKIRKPMVKNDQSTLRIVNYSHPECGRPGHFLPKTGNILFNYLHEFLFQDLKTIPTLAKKIKIIIL